jgi:glycosyltransferase involved in cell wall biosynthesis
MNVLMTADAVGGVWTYAIELARALAPLGVRTTLATMGPRPGPEQRRDVAAIDGLALRVSTLRLEWMDDPWEDVARAGDWLRTVADEVRPDVVHLNGYCHGAVQLGVPKVVVGHSCVTSWWLAVLGEPAPPRYDRYRREVGGGLQGAAAVVTPTGAYGRALAELYGPLRRRTIHNGIDPAAVRPARTREPEILAAGRLWDRAKNLSLLDVVAPRLPWPVRVAGDAGGARPAAVELLGALPRSTLLEHLGRAAVFCHPALYEPFGLAPLEAAASGCALVLGDIATLRELWHGAALFVDPRDPDALRAALDRLCGDDALRRDLAAAARRRAERYSAAAQARATHALYREVLRRPVRRSSGVSVQA